MCRVAIRSRRAVQAVSRLLVGCVVGLLFAVSPAWAVEPPAEQLDCRVHDTTTSNIGLAFKIAGFLFKAGPEITFNHERGVAWDKIIQGFIARYKELCSRYNAGMVTKEEYEARLKEMEGLHREAMALERKLMDETRNRAKAGIDELDRTLAQRKATEPQPADPVKVSMEDLSRRIESIDIKKGLGKGKRPNDVMGTMGREQQSGGTAP